ncbi:MAG TPA: hypothetical protein VHK01_20185 [Lacipirellulaceae bacterium]|nr:hypothetical protein [Lacipirellulaceae bacterium]
MGRRLHVTSRTAFTLFELILAIALSVTLVALIGTAINLYLTRVDASRTEVEEAQLARSILTMIADDLRATAIYKPQDMSAIQQLAAASAEFNPEAWLSAGRRSSGGGGGGGGGSGSGGGSSSGGSSSGGSASSGTGGGSSGGGASMGSGSGMSSGGGMSSTSGGVATDSTMPLGLSGSLTEMYVDTIRLPRREELFATMTGYTNAPIGVQTGGLATSTTAAATSGIAPPSDLKSVRYFVRPGEAIEPGSVAATSLAGDLQLRAGGLVRQEIPRSMRVWAEQSGNSAILDSGQALIAPEVVHIEFRYFDGTQITDVWEMLERNSLPVAIEIRLWIVPATEAAQANVATLYNAGSLPKTAREYRQTVYLPMSELANSAMGGMSGSSGSSGSSSSMSSSTAGGSSSSSSGGSGSQTGSSFGQQ